MPPLRVSTNPGAGHEMADTKGKLQEAVKGMTCGMSPLGCEPSIVQALKIGQYFTSSNLNS